ncbi:MAG: response regulator [Holosporales bacterium]|jgi:CheY-like chemotaxis protein/DNA-binding XRE family transcriptional regulator|nr:response regulator [Holosporales bacterium]
MLRRSSSPEDKLIGRQLREKRLRRGMTLLDAAKKLGVSYQQVQKYEQASSKISASNLYKLSILYGVSIEKFFEGMVDHNRTTYLKFGYLPGELKNRDINLLMIEDNPGDEAVIRRTLSDLKNLNILCVHDGHQVMEVLRYKTLCADFPRPDLIFLDIYLPKRDGISVLKEIKRDSDLQDIPVVIITNNINPELMQSAYRNGASGYICKSFDFVSFKDHIVSCVKYWTNTVVLPTTIQSQEGKAS